MLGCSSRRAGKLQSIQSGLNWAARVQSHFHHTILKMENFHHFGNLKTLFNLTNAAATFDFQWSDLFCISHISNMPNISWSSLTSLEKKHDLSCKLTESQQWPLFVLQHPDLISWPGQTSYVITQWVAVRYYFTGQDITIVLINACSPKNQFKGMLW